MINVTNRSEAEVADPRELIHIFERGRCQDMGNGMDYIYTADNQEIFIEVQQKSARKNVIEQYIQCRKDKGLTQAELARRAGIPRTNITRFESGTYNPSLEMMVRLASALDMELEIGLVER